MKAIKLEVNKFGHMILTCEQSFLFGLYKTQKRFIATEECYPKGYWKWRSLPNKTLVGDFMGLQLDSWAKDFRETERLKFEWELQAEKELQEIETKRKTYAKAPRCIPR
tara:strand:- start:9145 stop:9471 length:327 start_codon:yes stop_codon:yes gene_type:complete